MKYDFKFAQELGWAVLIGVVVVVAQALLTFDESVLKDWEPWAVGLLGAAARSVGASLLNAFRPGGTA